MIYKFYDTCSLLLNINHLWDDQCKIVISSITLKELDNIKTSANKDVDVKFAARKLVNELNEHSEEYCVIFWDESYWVESIGSDLIKDNDAKIIMCANEFQHTLNPEDKMIFITNDLFCKELAHLVLSCEIDSYKEEKYNYSGYKEIIMDEDEMIQFYSSQDKNPYNLNVNEYLIIKDKDQNIVDKLCWTGENYRPLTYNNFKSEYFGNVKPIKGDIYQALAADSLENNKITLIKGPAGTGKAQPNNTLIPTPKGYKKLGDLQIGDKIFDRLGNETTVKAIYPQGLKENYKITFSDGRVAYCNDEHLWSYYTSKGSLKTVSLKEMIKTGLQTKNGNWRYKIPINNPIPYTEKNYDIDPYVIGVFLGDGCCLEKPLTLSSSDIEIVEEIGKLIKAKNIQRQSAKNYNWTFELPDENKNYTETLAPITRFQTQKFFKDYPEIIQPSHNKHIPEIYKFGSIEQRFSLIQGLMDTDGTIDNDKKGRTRFTSTSIKLIKDLQEICWSLGFSASISEDKRTEKYTNNICYNLTLSCPKELKPKLFRLKRKRQIALNYLNNSIKSIHSNKLTIKNIEKMPNLEEMTCILVDNPEHLYLTEQYIVTHNTYLSLGFLLHKLERNKINKIIVFCNTVATKNSAKLGFYPGSRDEKLLDSQIGNLLSSKLGGRIAVEQMMQREELVLLPLSDIRGYDTSGMCAGIYISEAQNLDIELMKLALQRIGEDCICIIDGDDNAQVDDIHFSGCSNGMKRVSQVFRGSDLYGEIELKNIHRSRIANLAENM